MPAAATAEQHSGGYYLGVWAAHVKKKPKEPAPEIDVPAVPRPVLTLKPVNVASLSRLEARAAAMSEQLVREELRRLLLKAQEEQDIAFVIAAIANS